jgi:hypothetical protein
LNARALLATLFLIGACANSHKELLEVDVSKLDACLRELVLGSSGRCDYETFESATETRYAVFIRTTQAGALSDAGISIDSSSGPIITARLTIEELRRVSGVPGVIAVENPQIAEATSQ